MNIQPTATTIPTGAEQVRSTPLRTSEAAASQESSSSNSNRTEAKSGTLPANNEDIKSAVSKVSSFLEQQAATDLSFSVDDETNIRVIKVVDRSTKEVIRQIPSEEMLQMAQALDKLQGLLLKQKA